MANSNRLAGRKCVVTGGAKGIGAAIVEGFAAEGAEVWVADADMAAATQLAEEPSRHAFAMDVSSESDWDRLRDALPAVDVVVNNAGVTGLETPGAGHDPEYAGLDDWRRVHAVNLDGVFLGCRYAIRAMREKGAGAIINISSVSGVLGAPFAAAYASSKAAVRHHTKTVALYCAQEGLNIRCNSIHPGPIMTPMWDAVLGEGEAREAAMKASVADVPLARFGEAREVAALATMLASDDAAYMTGAELIVDGGLCAGRTARRG